MGDPARFWLQKMAAVTALGAIGDGSKEVRDALLHMSSKDTDAAIRRAALTVYNTIGGVNPFEL